jgi:hypothetical protein
VANLKPVLSFLPSVYYVNTVDSSRRTPLVPPGSDAAPVSITNYGDTNRPISAASEFELPSDSERDFGLGGFYNEQRFMQTEISDDELEDSDHMLGRATVSYQVSPRTQGGLLGAASRQHFSQSPDAETYSGGRTYAYRFAEAVQLNVVAGISYARQESVPGRYSENDTSPAGGFNLTYSDKTFSATLYGSYVTAIDGYGSHRQGTVALPFRIISQGVTGACPGPSEQPIRFHEDAVDTNRSTHPGI